jgi:hypothetical protein
MTYASEIVTYSLGIAKLGMVSYGHIVSTGASGVAGIFWRVKFLAISLQGEMNWNGDFEK